MIGGSRASGGLPRRLGHNNVGDKRTCDDTCGVERVGTGLGLYVQGERSGCEKVVNKRRKEGEHVDVISDGKGKGHVVSTGKRKHSTGDNETHNALNGEGGADSRAAQETAHHGRFNCAKRV